MRKICQGLLYFPVEGGIQPGRWELIIEFEEFDARVPFEIERPPQAPRWHQAEEARGGLSLAGTLNI
jgi:hypothetical protein